MSRDALAVHAALLAQTLMQSGIAAGRDRADEVICTADESIGERVMQITEGSGAYGATDAVGGDTFSQVVTSLRKGGTGGPSSLCVIAG